MSEPAPRKTMRRLASPGQARSITFSCRHRLPLLGTPALRDAFGDELASCVRRHPHRLFAWAAMPEHVHLVLAPRSDPGEVVDMLHDLKRTFARRVIARWKSLDAPILPRITDRNGRIRYWQPGGGWDRAIREKERLRRTIEYIHANPVRRGLVDAPAQWKWSSYEAWHGDAPQLVPIDTQW